MSATIINLAEAGRQLRVAQIMRSTVDAYRRTTYGEVEWAKCCGLMLDLGHGVEAAAALLESRIPRWAQESAVHYDAPTSDDLGRFLNSMAGHTALQYELSA